MIKKHWVARVRQGHASYNAAKSVAQLLVETESDDLSRPDAHEMFEAIDNLKIVADPPASFEVAPLDGVPEEVLASKPDWFGESIRVWLLGRESGHVG
jgi:hypothetical protein